MEVPIPNEAPSSEGVPLEEEVPSLEEVSSPDWDKGLPLDVLSLVAKGSKYIDHLKAMREVCKTWQKGFEGSVAGIRISKGPLLPLGAEIFAERFYGLTLLDLSCLRSRVISEGDQAHRLRLNRLGLLDLESPSGQKINLVSELSQQVTAVSHGIVWGVQLKWLCLVRGLHLNWLRLGASLSSDKDLKELRGLRLTALEMSDCQKITGEGFCYLKDMPLTRLDLYRMENLSDLSALHSLPLTRLSLQQCPMLDNLESLRGKPLKYLGLAGCPGIGDQEVGLLRGMPLEFLDLSGGSVTGEGLEVLRGMPLATLDLSFCPCLTDASLAFLEGLPLTQLRLENCRSLTNEGLRNLKGLRLDLLVLEKNRWLRREGLEHLRWMTPHTTIFISYRL